MREASKRYGKFEAIRRERVRRMLIRNGKEEGREEKNWRM